MVVNLIRRPKKRVKESFQRVGIISIIIFLIPLIVRAKFIEQTEVEQYFYHMQTAPFDLDIYSWYKSVFLMLLTILVVINLLWMKKVKKMELKLHYIFIPFAIFYGFLAVSSYMSEYSDIALNGFSERYEGFYTYTYYILLTFCSYMLIQQLEDVSMIYKAFVLSAVLMSFLGLYQFLGGFLVRELGYNVIFGGIDPYYSGYIQRYLGDELPTRSSMTVGTLFNPNYLGSYSVMAFVVAAGLYIKGDENKVIQYMFYGSSLCTFFLLMASKSNAGFLALMVVMMLYLIGVFLVREKKYFVKSAFLIVGMIFVFVIMNVYENSTAKEVLKINHMFDAEDLPIEEQLKDIQFNGNEIRLVDNYSTLVLGIDENHKIVVANQDEIVEFDYWTYTVEDYGMNVKHHGHNMDFQLVDNDTIGIYSGVGLVTEMTKDIELVLNGEFASNRGCLWSGYISVIKKSPFIGYGLDTYAIYYPQLDLLMKINYMGKAQSLSINPHSMYLQIAFSGGIFSLLAFLVFLIWYGLKNVQLFVRKEGMTAERVIAFFAIVAFMIAGIVNDTIVGIGPVFYILLGVGCATTFKWNELNDSKDINLN